MIDYILMIKNDMDIVPAVLFLVATLVLAAGASSALLFWLYQIIRSQTHLHQAPLRLGALSLICCLAIAAIGLSLQGLSHIWSQSAALLNEDLSLNTRSLSGLGMFIAGIAGLLLALSMMGIWSNSDR